MKRKIRCDHKDATEVEKDEATKDIPKGYPDHWFCPDCETYFPLIGDSDYWIVYREQTSTEAADFMNHPSFDSQTIQTET